MRILLVINATITEQSKQAIQDGRSPRKDYLELQRALGADLIDLDSLEWQRWTRVTRRFLGAAAAQTLLAWKRSSHYDAVFADRETTGLGLAALFKLWPKRPRLIMIGHLLSPPKKQRVIRALRLHKTVDCLIVHSSAQQQVAVSRLGFDAQNVALIPYQADEHFWKVSSQSLRNQICSVGLEYRDYETLIRAMDGLDADLVIAAASHWSKHIVTFDTPPRVYVQAFDYEGLRALYSESRCVVIPLKDVDNQAGITVILEAMAMGKAVVVSHTRGQEDVVRDRRRMSRTEVSRVCQPDWAARLGANNDGDYGHTGIYVAPGDPTELRRAIAFLLSHPTVADDMGRNGRHVIETVMGLDSFTERVVALIRGRVDKSDQVIPSALHYSNS